jgi:hypothetical protein
MLRFEAYYIQGDDWAVPYTFEIYPRKIQTDVKGDGQEIGAPTILPYNIPLGVSPQTIKIEFDCESVDSKILESLNFEMPITFEESGDYYEFSGDYLYYITDVDIKLETGSDQDSVSMTFLTTWESARAKGWELLMEFDNNKTFYPTSKIEIEKQVNDVNKAKVEIILTRRQLLAGRKPGTLDAQSNLQAGHPAAGLVRTIPPAKYSIIFGRNDDDSYNTVFVGYLDKVEGDNKNRMTVLLKSILNELKFKMVANPVKAPNPHLNVGGIIANWVNKYHPFKVTLPPIGQSNWELYDYVYAIMNSGKSGWRIAESVNKSYFEYDENPSSKQPYTPVTFENVPIIQGLKSILYEESGIDFWANADGLRRIYYDPDVGSISAFTDEEYYAVTNRHIHSNFEYDTLSIEIDKYYDSVHRVYVFGNDGQEYGAFGADGVYYSTAFPPEPDTEPIIIFKLNTGVVSRLNIDDQQVLDWLTELTKEDKQDMEIVKAAIESRGVQVHKSWFGRASESYTKTYYYINDYTRIAEAIYNQLGSKKEKFVITALITNDRDSNDNLIWNVNEGDWLTFKFVRNPISYANTYGDDSGNYEEKTMKVKAVKINGQKVTIELGAPRNSFFDLIDRKMTEVRQGNITGTRSEQYITSGDLS